MPSDNIDWNDCPKGAAHDETLKALNKTLCRIEKKLDEQDHRIGSVEKWKWMITGGMIFVTAGASLFLTLQRILS